MKLVGTSMEQCVPDFEELPDFIDLGEVCIVASPKRLRKIAKFLKQCAEEIEGGNKSDHYHMRGNVNSRPDIIVINKDMDDIRQLEKRLLEEQQSTSQ